MISLLTPYSCFIVQRLQPAPTASQPSLTGTTAVAKLISFISEGVSFQHECLELHCSPSGDNVQQAREVPLFTDVQLDPAKAFLPCHEHHRSSRVPFQLSSVHPEQHSSNHSEDSEQRKPLSFSPPHANQTSRSSFCSNRATGSRSNRASTTATHIFHLQRKPVSAPLRVSNSCLSYQPHSESSGFPQLRPAFSPCHPTHQFHGAA